MADNRLHFYFNNPLDGSNEFRYNVRGIDNTSKNEDPDYSYKIDSFIRSIEFYDTESERRIKERNNELGITRHVFYIEIEFVNYFDTTFESYYRNTFGLSPASYYEFNTKGLFAIIDEIKFLHFLKQVNLFIQKVEENESIDDVDQKIRYISSFELLTTERILAGYSLEKNSINIQLIDNIEIVAERIFDSIEGILIKYIEKKQINYVVNEYGNTIDIFEISDDEIKEIARNFDILHSVISNSAGIIGPSKVGVPERSFPFDIAIPEGPVPLVGILDTGVSDQTPLSSILINSDSTYHVNNGNPLIDNADNGYGHGTAVAAFAALGNKLTGNVSGTLETDAKILSIKILEEMSGHLSNKSVLDLIRKAYVEKRVRIFVLTVSYSNCLTKKDVISDYAYQLDLLSYELDILIFISTGNNLDIDINDCENYPDHFLNENSNIHPPGESMNNMTVGAIGSNFEPDVGATLEEFPALYTTKYHIDYEKMRLKNAKLFKPDILFPGGNYSRIKDNIGDFLEAKSDAALQCLSARTGYFFDRSIGTSYAAPLAANLAAKILRVYPDFRLQTVKALIINSSNSVHRNFNQNTRLKNHHSRFITGNGIPIEDKCIFSNDNEVNMILEDDISVGTIKTYELKIPDYFLDAYKEQGLIEINATLCFKFNPIAFNQIAYCPINIAFGIFKNLPAHDTASVYDENGKERSKNVGINGNNKESIAFSNVSWSQDAIYKGKMLSNSQKMRWLINKQHIVDNDKTFKIAINAHFHKLLTQEQKDRLQKVYEFSLIINLKENFKPSKLTGMLYDEIQLVNSLEVISDVDLDLEL